MQEEKLPLRTGYRSPLQSPPGRSPVRDDLGCTDFNENVILYLCCKLEDIFIFFYQISIVLLIILSVPAQTNS